MKTILPQSDIRANSGFHSPATRFPELASQSPHAPALWSSSRSIFAPPIRGLRTDQIQDTLAATKAAGLRPAFYMSLPESSGPEGFVFGLVVGAAFLAIAYSFCCGIQLIQHWTLFSAGIGRLIQ